MAGEDDDLLPMQLVLEPDLPGRTHVLLQPQWRAAYAEAIGRPPSAERPSARVMSFDTVLGAVAVYPVRTFPNANFLRARHAPFKEFVFEGWTRPLPDTIREVMLELRELPAGFISDPSYGLGIDKEFEPILHAIRRVAGVRSLFCGVTGRPQSRATASA